MDTALRAAIHADQLARGSNRFDVVSAAWTGRPEIRPSSASTYRERLIPVNSQIGSIPIAKLTTAHLRGLLDHLQRSLSPSNAKNTWTTVRSVLNWAKDQELIRELPAFPSAKFRVEPRVHLTWNELSLVVTTLREPYDELAWFLTLTGLRIGEALGIRPADVDTVLGHTQLTVRWQLHNRTGTFTATKTRPRTVALSPRAAAILANRTPGRDGRLWPMSRDHSEFVLRDHLKDLKLWQKGLGWHEFRHQNATLRAIDRQDPRYVQAQFGHRNLDMTLHYGRAVDAQLHTMDAVAEALLSEEDL